MSSDLCIEKLSKMYNAASEQNMHCKSSFFRKVFNKSFNIGFNAPQVDVCSTCLEFKEKIKREKDATIKTSLLTSQKIHKLRAKAFFGSLKEVRKDLLTISYDCEKNLVLPKIPDQITYYKRQLYLYNFSVVIGSSKSKLTKENVFMHSWLESECNKGSNEIASAIFDTLNKIDIDKNIREIRLISDGCTGQNKNSTVIAMCAKWLLEAPKQIKKIQLLFPVTGHSFLPADRVFALIEKKVKKLDTIIHPEIYYELFEMYGTLKKLGSDWHVQDWKKEAQAVLKSTASMHFKITTCKRIVFTRSKTQNNILVKGEPHYNSDVNNAQGICKRGKKLSFINPQNIELNAVQINPKKLKNIDELLTKHFGATWKERSAELNLDYYKELLSRVEVPDEEEVEVMEQEEDQYCVDNDAPSDAELV